MKKSVLYVVIGLIIIIGIALGMLKGLNYSLEYQANQKIELYIGKVVDRKDIEEITNNVFGKNENKVQIVEIFNDMVAITVKDSNDEQIENFVNAINEKYGVEYTKDDVEIIKESQMSILDIIKPYIIPIIIALALVVIYIAIRYHKLGFWKILLSTILWIIVIEALLYSIYAIIRLPVNAITIPIALMVFVFTVLGIIMNSENKLKLIKKDVED